MSSTPATLFRTSLLCSAMLLTACGGGGGGSSSAPGKSTPAQQSSLTVDSPASKTLQLRWQPVEDAASYRLLLNVDGQSGYEPVTNLLDSLEPDPESGLLSYTFENLALHTLINARYILQVCDSDAQCTDTSSQTVASYLTGAIGYLKAEVPWISDGLGYKMTLSADGSTMAAYTATDVLVFSHEGDGQWQQQAELTHAMSGNSSAYGLSLALSNDGNTLAVGHLGEHSAASGIDGLQTYSNCNDGVTENDVNCLDNSGAVFVYSRDNEGSWSEQAYIKADTPRKGGNFGRSIGLNANGNVLAIGSSGYGDNLEGAVYLFERTDGDWNQADIIIGQTTARQLGYTLALNADGTRLAVSESPNVASAVHVFALQTGNWVEQEAISHPFPGVTGDFGTALDLSDDGNTLAIADHAEKCVISQINSTPADSCAVTANYAGTVHIYQFNSDWEYQAYIKPFNLDGGDYFGLGISLSADGNLLAVGASREGSNGKGFDADPNNNDYNRAGAAYLFKREQGQWQQTAYLKAPNNDPSDLFGSTIALSGDGSLLVVGARSEDGNGSNMTSDQSTNTRNGSGAFYLF